MLSMLVIWVALQRDIRLGICTQAAWWVIA